MFILDWYGQMGLLRQWYTYLYIKTSCSIQILMSQWDVCWIIPKPNHSEMIIIYDHLLSDTAWMTLSTRMRITSVDTNPYHQYNSTKVCLSLSVHTGYPHPPRELSSPKKQTSLLEGTPLTYTTMQLVSCLLWSKHYERGSTIMNHQPSVNQHKSITDHASEVLTNWPRFALQ